VYDPESDSWRPIAGLAEKKGFHVAGVIGDKIYITAGASEAAPDFDWSGWMLSEIHRIYDPDTDVWSDGAKLPTRRLKASSAVVDGKFYVMGGYCRQDNKECGMVVEVYEPSTDSWTVKASIPRIRFGSRACVLEGNIYVVAGGEQARTMDMYDPSTDTWDFRSDFLSRRVRPAVAEVDGKIYVIGGFDIANQECVDRIERYDPDTDSWQYMQSLLPEGRTGTKAVVVDDKVYVMGGKTGPFETWGEMTRSVYAYDPALDSPVPAVAKEETNAPPSRSTLFQNYPNPFNPSTVLPFEISRSGKVHLAVYDALGREVDVLVDGLLPADKHEATFVAGALPSGIYLAQMTTPDGTFARTMVLMR
jgi:hypothetical protein